MYWIFCDIGIGRMFHFEGEDYVKQSTRTARKLSTGRAEYIKQTAGPCSPFAW